MGLEPGISIKIRGEDTELLRYAGVTSTNDLREGETAEFIMLSTIKSREGEVTFSEGVEGLFEGKRDMVSGPCEGVCFRYYDLKKTDAGSLAYEDVAHDLMSDIEIPFWSICMLVKKQPIILPGALAQTQLNVFEIEDELLIVEGIRREKRWKLYLGSERDGVRFEEGTRFFFAFE